METRSRLALQFKVAGAEISAQGVLAGPRPREVGGNSRTGIAEGSAAKIAHFDGSVHRTVIGGIWDGNRDIAGRAVDVFIAGDRGDLEITGAEMNVEVSGGGNLDRRAEIIVRGISDAESRMGAAGSQVGDSISGV